MNTLDEPETLPDPEPELDSMPETSVEPQLIGDQIQDVDLVQLKQKELYIQQLMKHIDAHKFYPGSARRRGVEGEIHVSFELTMNNTPANIEVTGSVSVLQQAARQALEDASPLPEPPSGIQFNSPVKISMVYALK